MDDILTFIQKHWGDVASVAGLFVSLIGFAITIYNVRRSKTAAQRAEEAALEVKKAISHADTMIEFSAAITMMEEIKRLHRAEAWQILPDRYTILRQKLIIIRGANAKLPQEHQTTIETAIQQFSDMEKVVEKARISGRQLNIAKLNEIVSAQIDDLNKALSSIKQEVGVEIYGRQKN